MQAYTKVERPREETKRNEIKVRLTGPINKYFWYAAKTLKETVSETDPTLKFDRITIRASGKAIRKAIILVEDIKQRIGNLHQINNIHTLDVIDVYEPLIEGLVRQEVARQVTTYDCILSREPINVNEPGY